MAVLGLTLSLGVAVAAITLSGGKDGGTSGTASCVEGACTAADGQPGRVPSAAAQAGDASCASTGSTAPACASTSASTGPSVPASPLAASTAPSAATQPTAAGPVDPSGQAMPVGDLPGWHQIFADTFGTDVPLGRFPSAVSSRWTGYSDGVTDTSGHGTYYPSKVISVHGGLMTMNIHTENGVHLVAAPEPILPGNHGGGPGSQTYGRYAIRFRADAIPGYKIAWLLWPQSGVWNEGEIDWPEGNLTGSFQAFVHHVGDPQSQDAYAPGAKFTTWHTAVIEWSPSSVTFLLDGKSIGSTTNTANIPSTPFRWVLQTETALSSSAPSDSASGQVQVDWVAVYSRA
jgi:beta-glucanase (GH16 family)